MFSVTRTLLGTALISSVLASVPSMTGFEGWFALMGEIYQASAYQEEIQHLKLIREELDERDAVVVLRMKAKWRTIEALRNREIDYLEAASVFKYLISFKSNHFEIVDPATRHFPIEVQVCKNLLLWLKGSTDEFSIDDLEFSKMVESRVKNGEAIPLPQPPVKLIAEFGF